MDMNKTSFTRKEDIERDWRLIDAEGKIVGRLATEIADILRGKNKPTYSAHTDSGDYVVVINADKIVFSGDKMTDKNYVRVPIGYMSGKKEFSAKDMMRRHPGYILKHAVKGMLGSGPLARAQFKKLKIYAGVEHMHKAQVSKRV